MIPIAAARSLLAHHLLSKSDLSSLTDSLDAAVNSVSTCLATAPDHFDAACVLTLAHLCSALAPGRFETHLALAQISLSVAKEISVCTQQSQESLELFQRLETAVTSWPLDPAELSALASLVRTTEKTGIDSMVDAKEEFQIAESHLKRALSAKKSDVPIPTLLSREYILQKLPLVINQYRKPPPFVQVEGDVLSIKTNSPTHVGLRKLHPNQLQLDLLGTKAVDKTVGDFLRYQPEDELSQRSLPLEGVKISLDPAFVGGIKYKDIDTTGIISVQDDELNLHHLDVGYLNLATAIIVKHELETLGAQVMLTRTFQKDYAASLDFYGWLDTDDGAGARRAVRSFESWLLVLIISLQILAALSPFVLGNPSYRELHSQLMRPATALKKFLFSSMYLQQHEMTARIESIKEFEPDLTICIST